MSLVEKIKTLCAEKNITVAALERRLDFGNGTIRKWDNAFPSGDKLAKVAQFFNVSVDYLLGLALDKYNYDSDPDGRADVIYPKTREKLNSVTGNDFRETWYIWQILRTASNAGEAADRLPKYDKNLISELFSLNWDEEAEHISLYSDGDADPQMDELNRIARQLDNPELLQLLDYASFLLDRMERQKNEPGSKIEFRAAL
ncbi:MAG: helix-turn-helix domain-containing protein [Clostridiales bacterium]|nr:helix-turn-helix domain-containing protein [Clostridiales bacterium]